MYVYIVEPRHSVHRRCYHHHRSPLSLNRFLSLRLFLSYFFSVSLSRFIPPFICLSLSHCFLLSFFIRPIIVSTWPLLSLCVCVCVCARSYLPIIIRVPFLQCFFFPLFFFPLLLLLFAIVFFRDNIVKRRAFTRYDKGGKKPCQSKTSVSANLAAAVPFRHHWHDDAQR